MHEPRLALIALFGFIAGACATNPDVVATGQSLEAGIRDGRFLTDTRQCYPGLYTGYFNYSTNPDAQSVYPVSGDIEFRLVETGNEFLSVKSGAKLTGKPEQGSRITAEIDTTVDGGSGGCYEGVFRVNLVNGEFYQNDASTPVKFTGIVEGSYTANTKDFVGQWKAFLGSSTFELSHGDWNAIWRPDDVGLP